MASGNIGVCQTDLAPEHNVSELNKSLFPPTLLVFVKSLSIKGFRGIKEMVNPIDLKKFNVLVGKNNSCKTTLMQALFLLPHPNLPVPFTRGERYYELLESIGTNDISSFLYRYAGNSQITYQVDAGEVNLDAKALRVKLGQTQLSADWDYLRRTILGSQALNEEQVLATTLWVSVPLIQNLLTQSTWGIIAKAGAHVDITKNVLNKCVNESFTELFPRFNELWLRKEEEGSFPIYLRAKDMGRGVQNTVAALLQVSAASPKLVLWDDFEANMHPSMIKVVLEYLVSKDWQVVLATHSIDALSQLVELNPKDAQVVMLAKDRDDVLKHKEITIEDMADLLEANQDPRKIVETLGL